MRLITLAIASAALLPMAVSAQSGYGPKMGDMEVTLSGSGSSNNDFDNHALGLQGSIGKYFSDSILAGVRQSFNYGDVPGDDDLFSGATRGFVDYVYDAGRFRPYVGVSLGAVYGDGVNESLAAGPEIGFKYYADENTFIFVQTEYQFTFEDGDEARDSFDDGIFFHAVGIGFNF